MFGGRGNDTLIGGLDNDSLNGGAGNDTADYRQSQGPLEVDLRTGLAIIDVPDGIEADALVAIESVDGTTFSDVISGDNGANFLNGLPGNDEIFGRRGNDAITGGPGDDTLRGGRGNDAISGGSDNDEVLGGRGGDFLFGNAGDDLIRGGRGSDIIDGGTGQDTILYRAGDVRAQLANAQDNLVNFRPLFDTIRFEGVFDPDTRASDVFFANNVNGAAVLTADFSGTPNTGTSASFFNNFARLPGFDANNVNFDLWQAFGVIEFI